MLRSALMGLWFLGVASGSAHPGQAADGQWHTWQGKAGVGIAGIGAEAPQEEFYLQLEQPLQIDGSPWYTLMTEIPLPVGEWVTLCGRVEVRTFQGTELHYHYPALVEISAFHACFQP